MAGTALLVLAPRVTPAPRPAPSFLKVLGCLTLPSAIDVPLPFPLTGSGDHKPVLSKCGARGLVLSLLLTTTWWDPFTQAARSSFCPQHQSKGVSLLFAHPLLD